MIKVLNILTDSNIGGAGRCLVNYLKYCDKANFDIKIVLPRDSLLIPEVRAVGYDVIEAEGIAERSLSPEGIRTLYRIIREEKPDIVHTHGSFSGRIAARFAGTKVIYTRHSAFPVPEKLKRGPGHWANGLLNSFFADSIIAVSPATAENLTDSGVPAKKITVMMNGVDPLKRSSDEICQAMRAKLSIPEGVFTAGILARLEAYKGHKTLLQAAKILKDEGRDFRILIGGSGPCMEEILADIQNLDLKDRVLFLGFVTNVSDVLSILHVQLNCSCGTEASSIALIEGMSLGLATVASDYGGNPWQVDDGETGLLFPTNDAGALAERIRRLMDDPSLLARLQDGAARAYRDRFTGAIFARNIESVYTKTLNRK